MSEMIERVASALWFEYRRDSSTPFIERAARAAIEAMRTPTEAMVEAAGATSACVPGDDDDSAVFYPAVAWTAMIDAALSPDLPTTGDLE